MASTADGNRGRAAVTGGLSSRLRHAFLARLEEVHRPAALTPRRVAGRSAFAGKATAVIGMRRAGKTTYLHQLRAERGSAGVPATHLPFLSLEDERLRELDGSTLGALIDEYTDRHRLATHADAHTPMCWFLDEIQIVPGWERLVRRLLDADGTEVFVSGSSAALLSREIATELRGRAWQVLMNPFGFDEALRHRGVTLPETPPLLPRTERMRVEEAFLEWLESGGFPEAQGLDIATRRRLLTDYVDVALLRDVIDRYGVTNIVGLRWLARQLLANAGAMFSVEKFHRALRSQGIAIARDTVHHHLSCLEDSFLVRTVWMETASVRQRMVNPRKAYPIDSGLISVYDRTGRANTGHALETAVLIELERRGSEVTYVRTPQGFEVDFLARHLDGTIELIQVCADATEAATADRELRALAAAGQAFPSATQSLLTLDHRSLPAEVPTGVRAQPAYEWILAAAVEVA